MRKSLLILLLTGIVCSLTSCAWLNPPNTKAIGRELGITIPKKYRIIGYNSDPFGFDTNITYIFQFDSLHYAELEKAIEGSPLFNTANEKGFDTLPVARKQSIIETLVENRMTSYWIRSDSDYVYDGNALIINEPDHVYVKVFNRGDFLPNQDGSFTFEDGTPVSLYEVTARVYRKKRTLYYNYIHI